MAKPLSILFVSSEVYPFAKVGGIADVSYSLPLAMRDMGHDIRVMLPKYGTISERKNRIHEINRLRDMPIPIGKKEELATVKSSSINNPRVKVQAYITTNDTYFDSKKGIYHDPDNWKEYPDQAERFIFFNRTVIETCLLLGWFPDIIHCNDWQTALIPGYVKALFPGKFKKTKIVFTVHNFGNQGTFPKLDYKLTGLPAEAKNAYRHQKAFNFLRGGLHYSDYITTVSPSYANEVLASKDLSGGFNTMLKSRSDEFRGIINGIDTWGWDPRKDKLIEQSLDSDYEEFKYHNKVAIINEFDFDYKPKTPIIGMVSRIDEQKGIPLFIEIAEKLLKENVQVVLLGEGDLDMRKKLTKISKKYPDKFQVRFDFNDSLAHQIEAGSDIFLMPSKYEPCGLNFMYSLKYGTIPVARLTGGIKDLAKNYDPKTKTGNSYVFKNYKGDELLKTIKKALNTFKNPEEWEKLIKTGLDSDFAWGESAVQYDEIYRQVMKD